MPANNPVATMYALKEELEAAHVALRKEYRSRPRRKDMGHVWAEAMNRSHYGLVLVRDYERFGDRPENAIDELKKNLARVLKATAKLAADPYRCTQAWRIKQWEYHVGLRWKEEGEADHG
jgi:hypothetical protein